MIVVSSAIVSNKTKNMGKNVDKYFGNTDNSQINDTGNVDKEINIKLYEESNIKPSNIILDNTSETGAIYDLTIEKIEFAIGTLRNQNIIYDFEISNSSSEKYYQMTIKATNKLSFEIMFMLQDNKIMGMGISSNDQNEQINEVYNEIITALFNKDYAQKIIKANKELLSNEYRYSDYTMYLKAKLTSIMPLMLNDEEMKAWNQVKEYFDIDMFIFIFAPVTEKYMLETKSEFEDTGFFEENKEANTFNHTESISYIKFISNTEFVMMLGVEGSKEFIKSGTYTRNGNEIILNITYDSEIEHRGESPKTYTTKIEILNSTTLKYVAQTETYIFRQTNNIE